MTTDTQQTITQKFDADVEKIFRLMIHSIYEQKDIFLRELVANASDACDKLRYLGVTGAADATRAFGISVHLDAKAKTITVRDNGIGMTRDELITNLGTIARSGTQKFLETLKENKNNDTQLIGQFGVGFYSAFMVAKEVQVKSRHHADAETFIWHSNGEESYTLRPAEKDEALPEAGTEITLHIKKEEKEFLDFFRLRHIITTYCGHTAFPITLTDDEGKNEVVNTNDALWLRDKKDITEEQYTEFYRSLSHLGMDAPWMTLHNKAEGALSYINLLYIPNAKPFDLFHPDRATRVKLYIKRMFIAEHEVEIIPQYLRFLRGIVDSDDLPLNISRETVQNSPVLQKIRKAITKRVLSELEKKATKDPEAFAVFWQNFGAVLKEGLCDGLEPREEILDVCRFHSTHAPDGMTSIKDYVARMKPEQKAIYYITGASLAAIQNSPQLEGFKKHGFEVLLLTDSVDEFWVNVAHEYRGTPLKSVTRSSGDLSTADEGKQAEETSPETKADVAALVNVMNTILQGKVKEVKASHRLTSSPVCLAVSENGMDIRMERFLFENKQLPQVSLKILEVNPDHPIIQKLAAQAIEENGVEKVKDTVQLLFAQANIVEGEPIDDVGQFAALMSACIARGL